MRFFSRSKSPSSTPTEPKLRPDLTKAQLKRATRTRKIFGLLTSFFLAITVIFLILVEIGGTSNDALIRDWYFIRIDLAHIIPTSVPNFALINTIAQTLGLHDFYQVGLWGFCKGLQGEGVTYCSKPKALYWFNPVEILTNELLAGASIQLPAGINDILDLIKLASQVMFGFFLPSCILSFILIFVVPFSVFTRWFSLPIAILTFINALLCVAGSIIATVMFVIFRNVISGVSELNIGAEVGTKMFAFMWVASAFALLSWLIQTGLCCCCASRRDVKTGRRPGSKKAYQMEGPDRGAPTTLNSEVSRTTSSSPQEMQGTQTKHWGRRNFPWSRGTPV